MSYRVEVYSRGTSMYDAGQLIESTLIYPGCDYSIEEYVQLVTNNKTIVVVKTIN